MSDEQTTTGSKHGKGDQMSNADPKPEHDPHLEALLSSNSDWGSEFPDPTMTDPAVIDDIVRRLNETNGEAPNE